jgi:hypothetical protein
MIFDALPTHTTLSEPIQSDRKNFRRLFHLTFLFFLVLGLTGRLLPRHWRSSAAAWSARESLVEEARRKANTILPFMFMR